MVVRTNLDYLAHVLEDYSSAFHYAVFYENRIPTKEESEAFNGTKSLLHWSGVRSTLPYEFNQNRDSLPNDLFERYCRGLIGVIDKTREVLIPFRERYESAFYAKDIDPLRWVSLLKPVNAYLWAVDDLEKRVKFYFPNLTICNEIRVLSAFEIALRHWYLVQAKEEDYIVPKQVGEKYSHLKSAKNIEIAYGKIEAGGAANTKQLTNIQQSLYEYPQIQRAIENDIAKL